VFTLSRLRFKTFTFCHIIINKTFKLNVALLGLLSVLILCGKGWERSSHTYFRVGTPFPQFICFYCGNCVTSSEGTANVFANLQFLVQRKKYWVL